MSEWGELRTAEPFRKLNTHGHYRFTTPCERCGGSDRVTTRVCFLYDAELCVPCTREFYVVVNAWPEQKELLKVRDMHTALKQALSLAILNGNSKVGHISTELALNMDRFIDTEGNCFLKAKAWVESESSREQPSITEFRNATAVVKTQIIYEVLGSLNSEQLSEIRDLFGLGRS